MNNRTAERFEYGEWVAIEPKDIKKGDAIRLYEPDGALVVECVTSSDTIFKNGGAWGFETMVEV